MRCTDIAHSPGERGAALLVLVLLAAALAASAALALSAEGRQRAAVLAAVRAAQQGTDRIERQLWLEAAGSTSAPAGYGTIRRRRLWAGSGAALTLELQGILETPSLRFERRLLIAEPRAPGELLPIWSVLAAPEADKRRLLFRAEPAADLREPLRVRGLGEVTKFAFAAGSLNLAAGILVRESETAHITVAAIDDIRISEINAADSRSVELLLYSAAGSITVERISSDISLCEGEPAESAQVLLELYAAEGVRLAGRQYGSSTGCRTNRPRSYFTQAKLLGEYALR